MSYTAVVLAGSRPGRDQFAEQLGTDLKALIAVGGEPMVRRPVRALLGSKHVGSVVVLTQHTERLASALDADPRVTIARSRGTIAETILALCDDPNTRWPLLVTTADHALLDPGMIEEFSAAAGPFDIAVGLVERARLLSRLPHSRRTWFKFRGGAYTGANLFVLRSPTVRQAIELWRAVEQDRKKGWRVLSLLGPGVLIGAALRMLRIEAVVAGLSRKLALKVGVVPLSNPLAGVDVDKATDHELVEAILAGRA